MLYVLSVVIFLIVYLIGSIPFGLVLTKVFLKQDVRKIGSGNIGATNVLRTGSKILAILTVILDAMKPYFAYHAVKFLAFIVLGIKELDETLTMAIAGVAIFAHCFPVYLKFKGGKGVATVFGSLFLFSFHKEIFGISINVVPFLCLITWLVVAFTSKKSSLSALITAILLPLYVFEFANYNKTVNEYLTLFYTFVSLFVILRHKANIKRLIKGEESNIKLKKEKKVETIADEQK